MSADYTTPHFSTAALISIDTQSDVLDGGTLEVAGTTQALSGIEALTRRFRSLERPIVHAIRLYLPDGSNVDLCRRRSVEDGAQTLLAGTVGSQLAGELSAPTVTLDSELLLGGGVQHVGEREVIMYKPRWGAFFETPLRDHLDEAGVDTLIFCGCNFPNCPRTSIYEASERDYRIVLVSDAISGLYDRGEREMLNIGVHLMTVREVVEAVELQPETPSA